MMLRCDVICAILYCQPTEYARPCVIVVRADSFGFYEDDLSGKDL